MKLLAWRITFGRSASFLIKPALLSVLFIFFAIIANSQNACPIGSASTNTICPAESVVLGTGLTVGVSYTWYRDGIRIAGPLPGDGGSTSFGFAINAASDAGHYYIEQTSSLGVTTCNLNTIVVLVSLPVSQTLTGGGPLCNGQRILSISGSEANVTYELILDNVETGITINSSSTGPKNFPAVTGAGTYSIRASKNNCSGVYSYFGNTVVTGDPANAIVNFTTTTTANISWPGSGNFIAEYGLKGFTPGSGATAGTNGTVVTASSSPVSLTTNLAAGNSYDVYIRQLCGASTYASSQPTNFFTNCASISSLTEGFEGVTVPSLPNCWRAIDYNNDGLTWFTTAFQPRTGTKALYGASGDFVILPPINLTGTKRLKFWVKTEYAPQPCTVRLSTTNNSLASFSNLLLDDTVRSQTFEEKIINLNAFSGTVFISIAAGGALKFDDFTLENIPACPGPALVKVTSLTNVSANVTWNGTGTFIVEYGLANFVPGTGATAGAGGTIISNAVSPLSIPGLAAGTSYDIYIRQNCSGSGNGFSVNSPKVNFSTFFNCAASSISLCINVPVSIGAGNGIADFTGFYPTNSTGSPTPGKELLYSFTPATTGVYYLDITAKTGTLSYLYKPVSGGCGNSGWTGIADISAIGKYPVGVLQATTPYYFLLDNPGTTAITQTFRICNATVAAPASVNNCITANASNYIPAYDPKPEYIIDNSGNLIASLDFSTVSNPVGVVNLSYFVNSGALRHDNVNKEYLDRNFTITTTNTPANPVGVTLYFANTELQNLINDPDDGVADIGSVADLKITRDPAAVCGQANAGALTYYLPQTGNGIYDANAKYVQFTTPGFSTFYLHGGSGGLFNNTILCPGSDATMVMNSPGSSYIYQWQVDNGTGFVNLVNNIYYLGVNSPALTITYPPTSYYGYKYRCTASNSTNTITSDSRTLRFSMTWDGSKDTVWENPDNWSCNDVFNDKKLPDANTDVVIFGGTTPHLPVLNSNFSCRSILLKTGATLKINSGFKLTVTGH